MPDGFVADFEVHSSATGRKSGGEDADRSRAQPRIEINFTLEIRLGQLDILGEVTGGGRYEDVLNHTIEVEVFGVHCRCLDLEALIRTRRAAGRPKDLEVIAELEAILEERQKR